MVIEMVPVGFVVASRKHAQDDYWGGEQAPISIDGTPVLDIKPVMAEFLPRGALRQPQWSNELMRHYWQSR